MDEEGNVTASTGRLPVKAVVRVRIPVKRPPPEVVEEGEEVKKEEVKPLWVSPPSSPRGEGAEWDEADIDDKVMLINPIGENYKIYVVH